MLQSRFATVGRSASFADEKQAPTGATAADRFAAFAGGGHERAASLW